MATKSFDIAKRNKADEFYTQLSDIEKERLENELNIIRQLVSKETDRETLIKDVDMMPAWMKRIIKPMLTA